jgi:predicted nucleic-acid-binding protein
MVIGIGRNASGGAELVFRVEESRAVIGKTPDLLGLAGSDLADRATALVASGEHLLLADLVLAECVYVLESFYELERERVATLMRAAIGHPTIETVDPPSLLPALAVDATARIDFVEAYLVAQAESTGVGEIASFDRAIDRVTTVTSREP